MNDNQGTGNDFLTKCGDKQNKAGVMQGYCLSGDKEKKIGPLIKIIAFLFYDGLWGSANISGDAAAPPAPPAPDDKWKPIFIWVYIGLFRKCIFAITNPKILLVYL